MSSEKVFFLVHFLSKIIIGQQNKKLIITLPLTDHNNKKRILNILVKEGFICGVSLPNLSKNSFLVFLKYNLENAPLFSNVLFYSRPGKKVYVSLYQLRALSNVHQNAIFVLSTSFGVITQKDALLLNVGGELLCKFW